MYLRPEGSVARWSGWRLLGLDKRDWEGVHITLAATFALLALLHIILNWKPLLGYLRARTSRLYRPGRELAVAALLVLVLFGLSVLHWQPVSGLVAWRASIKAGENLLETPPPVLDADKLQLSEIALLMGTDAEEILGILVGQNFEVQGPEDTLEKIAERAKATPQEVYRRLLDGLKK